GAQSQVVGSVAELHRTADAAWDRAVAEPDAEAPTWTRYVVEPAEVEFFQGDARRRHIRLRYRRDAGAGAGSGGDWTRELLWP
ncbi:pyridoxine 5'-phosphate oxidase C-terminal domain-containing protein, partial [Streptomyces parvus]